MTNSFTYFAGFLVNYFNNPSMEDVVVCMKLVHIEFGGGLDPDTGEWLVYSNMSKGGETNTASDAYVFDVRAKKIVMPTFGFGFSRMSQTLPARMVKRVNKSANTEAPARNEKPTDTAAQFHKQVATLYVKKGPLQSRPNRIRPH